MKVNYKGFEIEAKREESLGGWSNLFMKIKVDKDHCKGCVWLLRENVCPFERCIKRFGFIVDKE